MYIAWSRVLDMSLRPCDRNSEPCRRQQGNKHPALQNLLGVTGKERLQKARPNFLLLIQKTGTMKGKSQKRKVTSPLLANKILFAPLVTRMMRATKAIRYKRLGR